jgi:hypothetical protein
MQLHIFAQKVSIGQMALLRFASKACVKRFLITSDDENAASQIYVEAKGIMMAKGAFAINGYCFCRLIRKSASSLSLNSVFREEYDLV